jgi:hypothetical protein
MTSNSVTVTTTLLVIAALSSLLYARCWYISRVTCTAPVVHQCLHFSPAFYFIVSYVAFFMVISKV